MKISRFGSDVEADKHVGQPASIAHEGATYFHIKGAFIDTSAGAADAGKPIKLNASGKVDSSMLAAGVTEHHDLAGLGDDDHTQYLLADGSRALGGNWLVGGYKLKFDASNYYLQYTASKVFCAPNLYFEIRPSGDTHSLLVSDSGGDGYVEIKNKDGVTYIGDTTTVLADMVQLDGTVVTCPGITKTKGSLEQTGSVSTDGYLFYRDILLQGQTDDSYVRVRNQAATAYKSIAGGDFYIAGGNPTSDNYLARKGYFDPLRNARMKMIWKSTPNTLSLTEDNTWRTYDFTSITSSATVAVILGHRLWSTNDSHNSKIIWRRYGSTASWENYVEAPRSGEWGMTCIQGVDSEERAQYKCHSYVYSHITCRLLGYIEAT